MVLTYGVASTCGSGTRRVRACCRSLRSRYVARSEPSDAISASSASIHSAVSSGSTSGSCGLPTSRGIFGSTAAPLSTSRAAWLAGGDTILDADASALESIRVHGALLQVGLQTHV